MTSFSWGFHFNKIKFFTKKQTVKRGEALHKRELEKHYACKWLEWMCFMHMNEIREKVFLLNLKHVKMIHFSAHHNKNLFVLLFELIDCILSYPWIVSWAYTLELYHRCVNFSNVYPYEDDVKVDERGWGDLPHKFFNMEFTWKLMVFSV